MQAGSFREATNNKRNLLLSIYSHLKGIAQVSLRAEFHPELRVAKYY